jgi:hypothetical protein
MRMTLRRKRLRNSCDYTTEGTMKDTEEKTENEREQ